MQSICVKLTENGTGVVLTGSEADLRRLYNSIYEIQDKAGDSSTDTGSSWQISNFQYELRKMYSGCRESDLKVLSEPDENGIVSAQIVYSGKFILPVLIVQIHILNQYINRISVFDGSYHVLTNFIWAVLAAVDGGSTSIGKHVRNWLLKAPPFSDDYLYSFISNRVALDCIQVIPKKRFKALPSLLDSFLEKGGPYMEYEKLIKQQAKELGCSPDGLVCEEDSKIYEKLNNPKFIW